MHRENNKGPRTVPWETPDKTGAQSDLTPFITTRCCLKQLKKRIHPFQCLATNSIAKQCASKEFMRRCIKCLFKIQYECSTCPLLSKILAQSFITVVSCVSQLCPFLNACCLSDRSLYSSRWAMNYLNILCVRVTCKVHKSRKPGDNCTQVSCHSSGKGGRYLQETIPLGFHQCRRFHQCQLTAEKDEQIPDLTLLLPPLRL